MLRSVIKVTGMTCNNCVNSITKHIKSFNGVKQIFVSLDSESATVEYDSKLITIDKIISEIEDIGYKCELETTQDVSTKTISLSHLQAYSGIAFSTFSTLHVVNHLLGSFGKDITYHKHLMNLFRKYYHQPIVEIGLGTALCVHVYCAVNKILSRNKVVPASLPISRKLHRYSGYFLVISMIGHIGALRILPLYAFGYNKSEIVDVTVATYASDKLPYFFIPYYVILVTTGLYHTLHGLNYANVLLEKDPWIPVNSSTWRLISLASIVTGIFVTAGISGYLFHIDMPLKDTWKSMYNIIIPTSLQSRINN